MPDAETGTDRQQESVPTPLATAKNTPLQLAHEKTLLLHRPVGLRRSLRRKKARKFPSRAGKARLRRLRTVELLLLLGFLYTCGSDTAQLRTV